MKFVYLKYLLLFGMFKKLVLRYELVNGFEFELF